MLKQEPFEKGLRAAEKRLQAWGASITSMGVKLAAIGATGVTALLGAAKTAADMGSALKDASDRTGVGIETLSEFAFVADQSATSLEDMEVALKKMSVMTVAAGEGSAEAAQSLRDLGVSASQLKGMKPDEVFTLLGTKIGEIQDPAKRAAQAVAVFGKAGTRLLPLFKEGAAGLDAMRAKARALGVVWSTEDAEAAEAFGDQMSALWAQLKMTVATVGMALIPTLGDLISLIQPVIKTTIDWLKANKALVTIVAAVAVGITATGGALIVFGGTLTVVGTALGAFATALALVKGLVLLAISPVGLLVLGIGALGYVLVTCTDTGQALMKMLGGLSIHFEELKGIAISTWQGIRDAMSAGDLGLAAKIAWAGIKVAWLTGTADLYKAWLDFKYGFLKVADQLGVGLVGAIFDAIAKVKAAWLQLQGFLQVLSPEEVMKGMNDVGKELSGRQSALRIVANNIAVNRQNEKAGDMAARLAELDAAQAELDRLRAEAAGKAVAAAAKIGQAPQLSGPGLAKSLGTFDANVLSRLGFGGGTAERTAKAAEETAKGVSKVAENTKELVNKLVFI